MTSMTPAWPPGMVTGAGLAAALVLGALTGALCRLLLTHAAMGASTPGPDSTADTAPDYRALATPGFVAAVTGSAIVAGAVVVGWAPPAAWPVWAGIGSLGVLLGWVDAATTWLPTRLVHPLWLATGLGVMATGVVSWLIEPATWWVRPVAGVLGAVAFGLFFGLVWWVGRGGLGFGDVRLAVALGAAAAACAPSTAAVAAVLGTGLGAMWAVGRLLRRRRGTFPYGPFLIVGTVLAPLVDAWW